MSNSMDTISTRVSGLEEDVRKIDSRLEVGLAAMRADFSAAMSGIHTKLDRQSQPQWGVIWSSLGVMLAFLCMIGALAYLPIREGLSDIKLAHAQAMRDLKHERQADFEQLVRRDQRIWDSVLETRRQVDRLDGALRRQ